MIKPLTYKQVAKIVEELKQERVNLTLEIEKKIALGKKKIQSIPKKYPTIEYDFSKIIPKYGYSKQNNAPIDAYLDKAVEEGYPESLINKIFSIENTVIDISGKLDRIETIETSLLPEYEKQKSSFGFDVDEAIQKEENAKKKKIDLAAKYKDWKHPKLDKWLENYRKDLLELAKESKDMYLAKNVDEIVQDQKMSIIYKTYEKVGEIQDISLTSYGMDGGFNGVVTGEHGTVKIQTIGAGGYNIQTFHYRVIVR